MTQAFNLSQFANKVNTSGQADLTTGVTGTLPIANGGTNNASLAVTAGGTLYTDGSKVVNVGAGTSGQVLTSAGAGAPTWATVAAGSPTVQTYNTGTAATWTKPASANWVQINIWSGGGGGSKHTTNSNSSGGGGGGFNTFIIPFSYFSASTVTYTVGAAGSGATVNGDSGTDGGNSTVSITNYNGTGKTATFGVIGGYGGQYGGASAGGNGGGSYNTTPLNASGSGAVGFEGAKAYAGTSGNSAVYGGGSGGGTSAGASGGTSTFGGGGGGSCQGGAGTSYFAGNGGAGSATNGAAAGVGVAPSGAGGGGWTANGGNGAAGRVQFIYW